MKRQEAIAYFHSSIGQEYCNTPLLTNHLQLIWSRNGHMMQIRPAFHVYVCIYVHIYIFHFWEEVIELLKNYSLQKDHEGSHTSLLHWP